MNGNRNIASFASVAAIAAAIAATITLSGCVSQTTSVETKVADIAGKSDALYRAQIHTERASEYFRMGRLPVALDAAKQAVAAMPSHAPAYNMLGIIQMELGQESEGRTAYEKALSLAPNDSETLNNYGWYVCRKSPRESMQYFDQALKNPVYATPERALYNRGVCARRAGDATIAEASLRETLRRQPEFSPAMVELGDMYMTRGETKEAEAMLVRHNALVQQPGVDALWLGVRVARAQRDRTAEASYVQQLRRRFPEAKETRMALERN
jgi:type IV pilus assembly protein PilF